MPGTTVRQHSSIGTLMQPSTGSQVSRVQSLPSVQGIEVALPPLVSGRIRGVFARNVRTGEIKYFLSNQVVGRGGVTLRWLLRVAFGRWSIEACFRVAKEELGMDHFEVRGWRCIHRHYYVTALSYLLCSRIRHRLDKDQTGALSVEQVRRSLNAYLAHHHLPPLLRDEAFPVAGRSR